jgi:hypothetical protein
LKKKSSKIQTDSYLQPGGVSSSGVYGDCSLLRGSYSRG